MSVSARNWAIRRHQIVDWKANEGKGAWVPMNHGDKIVLLCLAEHTSLTERIAWPKVSTIAEWCCMSERAVNGHLRRLESSRLIVRSKRKPHNGQWASNVYELAVPDDQWGEDEQYMEDNLISF